MHVAGTTSVYNSELIQELNRISCFLHEPRVDSNRYFQRQLDTTLELMSWIESIPGKQVEWRVNRFNSRFKLNGDAYVMS